MFFSRIRRLFSRTSKQNFDQNTGAAGELAALKYLERNGYRVRERNWRSSIGEIDIICEEKELLVFVEVKSSLLRGDIPPEARVHHRKQNKIRTLAKHYLKNNTTDRPLRFDVIAVSWDADRENIIHIKDAF